MKNTAGQERREQIRKKLWPQEDACTGDDERGWFYAPRTLPLILNVIDSKAVSRKVKASKVYLELWSRHMSGGVIEMKHEGEHAYAAGYAGSRAIRTWQERMKILEEKGFIKTKRIANQQYRYVLLIHPTAAIERLRQQGMIDDSWLETYSDRQLETKERTFDVRDDARKMAEQAAAKVIQMNASKPAARKAKVS